MCSMLMASYGRSPRVKIYVHGEKQGEMSHMGVKGVRYDDDNDDVS